MTRETILFFQGIVREDRSVLEFLDADYTFVNERLANHYGIPDVHGDHFRRVSLSGMTRGGILTQASVLTITSNPTRTSPVKRGKWILENLSGRSASSSTAERAGLEGRCIPSFGKPAHADGTASPQFHLRKLPCADGSAGLRLGKL